MRFNSFRASSQAAATPALSRSIPRRISESRSDMPGAFGVRGIEEKIRAVTQARTNGIPFLGFCLDLQTAGIEFARNVLRLPEANSTEFDPMTAIR